MHYLAYPDDNRRRIMPRSWICGCRPAPETVGRRSHTFPIVQLSFLENRQEMRADEPDPTGTQRFQELASGFGNPDIRYGQVTRSVGL